MFQPVIPFTSLPGWIFLQRTLEDQTNVFKQDPVITRDTDYFEAEIGNITTAEQLVSDRRLLQVALGAFGLQEDINNRFLIQKVLEGGTTDSSSLANRLADDRYKQITDAFGFGIGAAPSTQISTFGAEITERYRTQEFEVAVGQQNEAMRLALNADRELVDIATSDVSEDTKWFRILGNPPLRTVFETALGLPSGFAQLDIERQLEIFKEKSADNLDISDVSSLVDDAVREDVIRTYLLRDQVSAISSISSGTIALSLLQSSVAGT